MDSVASRPQFGPHPITVESGWNISQQAMEDIAQYIEQRGIRTPVSQVVGFQQFVAEPGYDNRRNRGGQPRPRTLISRPLGRL